MMSLDLLFILGIQQVKINMLPVTLGRTLFNRPSIWTKTTLSHFSSKGHNYEKCLNEVTLLGRVGVQPQLRGSDERPCVTFSLATDQNFRNSATDTYTTYTDWHNIAVFKEGLRQNVYEGIDKGQRALVKGRIRYSTIEDKSGMTRNVVSIVADQVISFKS